MNYEHHRRQLERAAEAIARALDRAVNELGPEKIETLALAEALIAMGVEIREVRRRSLAEAPADTYFADSILAGRMKCSALERAALAMDACAAATAILTVNDGPAEPEKLADALELVASDLRAIGRARAAAEGGRRYVTELRAQAPSLEEIEAEIAARRAERDQD